VPWVDELENLVVIRTMSKAFGFAGLRVGYALAHPETAALLTERRPPAPISGFAASIAAAALRDPRLGDVEATIAERERVRDALVAAGYESWPTATNFVYVKTDEPLGERLEAAGIVVRIYPDGIRVTLGRPAENDRFLSVLGVEAGRAGGREATVLRTTTETALRLTLALDGGGRTRVETGIGFLDHLLTLLAFHAGFDLDLLAAGDLAVDDHHTVEDVHAALGTALTKALGSREGLARYGSAVVPMDEARATAAVDLVRRPHAEIDLAFGGDRVGTLAVSLLRHALERFAVEAGCTVHVDAGGSDDHHVAEAAYKSLGQALRQAVAAGGDGIRSTKGEA
jgi:imidazoleglycerol phosphate dehydratase HisB